MHLSLISIGRPEVGLALCDHLGVKDGMDWMYADPSNRLYDAFMTNRGWNTMIRPATALRFKDRIFDSAFGRKEGGSGGSMDQVSAKLPVSYLGDGAPHPATHTWDAMRVVSHSPSMYILFYLTNFMGCASSSFFLKRRIAVRGIGQVEQG